MAVQQDVAVRAIARVNLAAIERNAARMRRELAADSALCAVVKADGYGHGAIAAAQAALAGGATWLAVVAAQEAAALRAAGVQAPILVMGALSAHELDLALAARADVVAWDEALVAAAAAATGGVDLAGAMTHFATADERGDAYFGEQLERFRAWAPALKSRHPSLILHAANSAATLRAPAAHFDMVRAGVAIYGLDPFLRDAAARDLEPALELRSYVSVVKPIAPGQSAGYGRRFIAEQPT